MPDASKQWANQDDVDPDGYAKSPPHVDFGCLDLYCDNPDWLRAMTWDLPRSTTAFLAVIGALDGTSEERRAAVARFMDLPAAKPMPRRIRRGLAKRKLWP